MRVMRPCGYAPRMRWCSSRGAVTRAVVLAALLGPQLACDAVFGAGLSVAGAGAKAAVNNGKPRTCAEFVASCMNQCKQDRPSAADQDACPELCTPARACPADAEP